MYKSLKELKQGEKAVIVGISGKGRLKRRLMDMGITCGADVLFKKVAPLGDPIEVNVRGCELAIRKAEAEKIFVKQACI